MADVITFGEAMLRLTPPHFQRLEHTRTLEVEVGGAELNTAAGLVRLGRTVEWVSRLPDNPLGRRIRNQVREAGVGDRHIRDAADGRCGLYFLECGASPRASGLVYDRQDSAFARITPGDWDWPAILTGARWFHVTGITPALGPGPARVTADALSAAKAAGLTTSLDLNYRRTLWSEAEAGRVLADLLTQCDVVIATEADARQLFGITGDSFADVARQLVDRFGLTAVAGVKRETPLVWRNRFGAVGYQNGTYWESPWYEVEIVDRLGAGDALASGLIHGLLDGDFQAGVMLGAALGAIKHTIPGDLPWIDPSDVAAVMSGAGLRVRR